MICTVYRSPREKELYLFVAKGKDLAELPEALMQRFGQPESFMTLLLTPERRLARANAAHVLEEIRTKGYFLQLPPALSTQPGQNDQCDRRDA